MTVGFARKRLHLKQYILIEVQVKWPATTDLLLDASEMEKKCKEEIDKANIRSWWVCKNSTFSL